MAQVGYGAITMLPSFAGLQSELEKQLTGPMQKAAQKAGKGMETEFVKSANSTAAAVEKARFREKKATEELETAESKLREQKLKSEAANKAVETAARKREEAESKGIDAVDKAETDLIKKRAAAEKASRDLRSSEGNLQKAKEEVATATKRLADRQDEATKAQKGLNEEAKKSKGAFSGIKDSFGEMGDKVSEMGGPLGGVFDTLSNFKLGPVAGVTAVAGALGTAAGAVGKFSEDLSQSRVDMQNQFGLSGDAARDMQGEIADALGSGLGDYEATAAAVTQITQVWGDEVAHMGGQTAAELSDDFLAFNKTFERSAEETASTVDVLLNSGMVSSAQEGLDLLTSGMQQVPAAMQDEVFDALNEYSKNFSNLGISGEEAMAMLVDAAGQGQYAIDKTGDAIKEFSVLAIDPAKAEAFGTLGIDAEEAARKVAEGGEGAREALQDTAQALLDMEDPGARAATAVELFGAPIEDLGVDQIPGFLESLTAGSDGMGDFAGSAQEMADNTSGTLSGMFASWKGNVHGWAIDATLALNEWAGSAVSAVGGFLAPVGDMFTSAKDTGLAAWDELTSAFTGGDWGYGALADIVGASNAEWIVDKVGTVGTAWEEISQAFQGGDWGYGALAELVGADNAEWIIGKISSVIPAFDEVWAAIQGIDFGEAGLQNLIGEDAAAWLFDTIDRVRDSITGLTDGAVEAFEQAREAIGPVLEWLGSFFTDQMGATFSSIGDALGSIGSAFADIGKALGGALWDALTTTVDLFMSLWDLLSPLLLPVLKLVAGVVGGVLVGAFMAAVGAIRVAAEIIEVLANIVQWLAENVLSPLIGLVADVATVFADVLTAALEWVGEKFSEMGDGISSGWDWLRDNVFQPFASFVTDTLWPAVQSAWDGIKDGWDILVGALQSAWENVIQPVFNAIWEVVQITLGVIGTLILAPLLLAWEALSAGIQWAWENVIQPVFSAVAEFATETLWPALQSVFQWIGEKWQWLSDTLGAIGTWITENIFEPIRAFLMDTLWPAAEQVFTWMGDKFNALKDLLGAAWSWISDNVFTPIIQVLERSWEGWQRIFTWMGDKFNAFRDLLGAAWSWINDNVFSPMKSGVQIVADWTGARLDDINSSWNTLKDALHQVWIWVDSNVFTPLKQGLDTVKNWFDQTVTNIGTAWDKVANIARKPVVWAQEWVFNKGIRPAWNAVARLVNADQLGEVDLIGSYALGTARVPGARTRHDNVRMVSTDGRFAMGLRGGEGVVVPEVVDGLGEKTINDLNAVGLRNGAVGVRNYMEHLGGFSKGGIIDSMAGFVSKHFPDLQMTSDWRFTDNGMHSRGQAADFSNQVTGGPSTPASRGLARAIDANFRRQTEQLIHWREDGWKNLLSGRPWNYGEPTNSQHTDHVHWGMLSPLNYDADELNLSGAGGGVFESMVSVGKRLWDGIIDKIPTYGDESEQGMFGKLPGQFLSSLASKAWSWLSEKLSALGSAFSGGSGAGAEQWRGLASQALKIWGYDDRYLDAMVKQIEIESNGDPNAINLWDENATVRGTPSAGLLQVIEPTYQDVRRRYPQRFEGLPDDRTHPLTNLVAGIGALERDWGGPAGGRWPTRDGYSEGGIVDMSNLLVRDFGGIVPSGAIAANFTGRDELMLPPETTALANKFFREFPAAAVGLTEAMVSVEKASIAFEKAMDHESVEGITARQTTRAVLGLGIDLPGADVIEAVLDAEQSIWEGRARQLGHLTTIQDKQKSLEEAQQRLLDLQGDSTELTVQQQRKLDDAQKAVDEAKSARDTAGQDAKDETKRKEAQAKATDKVTDAEEKLRRVREDLAADGVKSEEKRAEEVQKAQDDILKAEQDLSEARRAQVMDLDHVIVLSQGNIAGLGAMAEGLAGQVLSMGAPAGLVSQGLGAVTGALSGLSAAVGPAGLSLGVVLSMAQAVIGVVEQLADTIGDLVRRVGDAVSAGWGAVAEMFGAVAQWQGLVAAQHEEVSKLQQQVVRDMMAHEQAVWSLRLANFDRVTAEQEGIVNLTRAAEALREYELRQIEAARIGALGLSGSVDRLMWASEDALEAAAGAVEETVEWRALAYDYWSEAAAADASRLASEKSMLEAFRSVVTTTTQLQRTQQDLILASAALNRMTAETYGYTQKEAVVGSEAAQVQQQIAELEASIAAPGGGNWITRGIGKLTDWDGDGKTFGANNPFAARNKADRDRLEQLNRRLDELMSMEDAPDVGDFDVDAWRENVKWMSIFGQDTSSLIASSPFGQANDAIAQNDLLNRLADIDAMELALTRSIEDLELDIAFAEAMQPIEERMLAFERLAKAFDLRAQAEREENEAIRDAILSQAETEDAIAAVLGVTPVMVSNPANVALPVSVREPQEINLTVTLPAGKTSYTAEEVAEIIAQQGLAQGATSTSVYGGPGSTTLLSQRRTRI